DERYQTNDCGYGDFDIRHLSLLARTSQRCWHDQRSQRQEAEFGRHAPVSSGLQSAGHDGGGLGKRETASAVLLGSPGTLSQRERAFATAGNLGAKRGNLDTGLDHVNS